MRVKVANKAEISYWAIITIKHGFLCLKKLNKYQKGNVVIKINLLKCHHQCEKKNRLTSKTFSQTIKLKMSSTKSSNIQSLFVVYIYTFLLITVNANRICIEFCTIKYSLYSTAFLNLLPEGLVFSLNSSFHIFRIHAS